jgi:hypothetical protein
VKRFLFKQLFIVIIVALSFVFKNVLPPPWLAIIYLLGLFFTFINYTYTIYCIKKDYYNWKNELTSPDKKLEE